MDKKQNLLTIKAFAEASGRSQQTIYKQIGTRLAPYVHEIDGQKFIERNALAEVFKIGVQPEENNSFSSENNPEHELYAILREELAAKNRQIEHLEAELAEERKHSREQADQLAILAARAQDLHAGTIKTQLPLADEPTIEVEAETDAEDAQPEKKGFWHWLIGK